MFNYQEARNLAAAAFGKTSAVRPRITADHDEDVHSDMDTILAATEKLLAINRGEGEPDERDSLAYKRVHTPDKLLAERIEMDAGKVRRVAMRRLAKARTLKPIGVSHFDPYSEGLVVGHPLSSPLEEINPLSLVEQARRVTGMGPGGIPSSESITEDSQNVHPSQFGFLSATEGPESEKIGVDARLAHNARIGSDGKIYQQFHNRRKNKLEWVSPDQLVGKVVGLPE